MDILPVCPYWLNISTNVLIDVTMLEKEILTTKTVLNESNLIFANGLNHRIQLGIFPAPRGLACFPTKVDCSIILLGLEN